MKRDSTKSWRGKKKKDVRELRALTDAGYSAGRVAKQQSSFKEDRLSPRERSGCDGVE